MEVSKVFSSILNHTEVQSDERWCISYSNAFQVKVYEIQGGFLESWKLYPRYPKRNFEILKPLNLA